ncbi:MAG: NUDIX domain-containing protein [Firmicutes bacterium]|nr:NUDIX domain-containing protein [Bacillota bacterium]
MSDTKQDQPNDFVQWRHAPASRWIYCPLCREPLSNQTWDGRERRYCAHCGFVYWERALPAVAVLVFEPVRQEILLVTRRYPPFAGGLTFPGGGIELGESVVDAAVREVREETGLLVSLDRQFGTWATPHNDTIITFFRGHPIDGEIAAGSDAEDACFYPWDKAPSLAFSLHNMVLHLFRTEMGMTIPASQQ